MSNYQQSLAVLEHHNAEAERMSYTCPWCGKEGLKVRAAFKQATRTEPTLFLGYEAWCIPCQMTFKVETPQLTLAA